MGLQAEGVSAAVQHHYLRHLLLAFVARADYLWVAAEKWLGSVLAPELVELLQAVYWVTELASAAR